MGRTLSEVLASLHPDRREAIERKAAAAIEAERERRKATETARSEP